MDTEYFVAARCGLDSLCNIRWMAPFVEIYLGKEKGTAVAVPFRTAMMLALCCDLCGLGGFEGCLGLDREGGEACGVIGGDVGQDLAIELVACLLEAVDEGRVAHAVQLGCGADTDDPERAELTLLLFTAGVGEHESALDGFLGCLIELGFSEEVSTRALEDLFAAVVAFCTTFYTRHGASPFAYIV